MNEQLCRVLYFSLAASLLGAATPTLQVTSASQNIEIQYTQMSAPPGRVPPNASRIVGTVLKYTVWSPEALQKAIPPVSTDQPLYSVTLQILASEAESSVVDSLAMPGSVIEAFSPTPFTADIVGKRIHAIIRMTGDTNGAHWDIANVTT
jgi:hypothetical protein